MNRILNSITWISFLVIATLSIVFASSLSRAIVRSSLKINMHHQLAHLKPSEYVEDIIFQLQTLQQSRGLNLTLIDSEENVLYAHHFPTIPNVDKIKKKNRIYGQEQSMLYAATMFEVGEKTYFISNSIHKDVAKQIQRLIRFVLGFFSVASLSAFAFLQFLGIKLGNRNEQNIRSQLNSFLKFGDLETLEALQTYKGNANVSAILRLKEQNDALLRDTVVVKEKMKGIVDSLNEGVILLDTHLTIDDINLKATQLLKLISIEFKGHSLLQLIEENPTALGKKTISIIESARMQKAYYKEAFELEEDKERCFEIIVSPIKHSEGLVVILQDHSSDYKILSMGKNFVANASHELRTPITIIRGFTETIREIPDISREMLNDITDKILRNCHRMTSVVKSLLVLADLDYSGKATMQPCDLVGLVESCSYTLLSAYPQVKIETLFNENESLIWGDPDLLELAIMNLLENAVKYSKEEPFISVTVETLPHHVNISIKDRGVGIPENDLEYIFDRFYTVDKSRSRKLGGAGLGLSIVKTIVNKHSGKIRAQSNEGEGATFTIEFPRR